MTSYNNEVLVIVRYYNYEVIQSWNLSITMRCYNQDEMLQSWWGLTVMVRSYDHHEILQSWQSLKIMMKSYSHKILKSWWSFNNREEVFRSWRGSYNCNEVLQTCYLTMMMRSYSHRRSYDHDDVWQSWYLTIMRSYNLDEVIRSMRMSYNLGVVLRPWLSLSIMRSDGYDETKVLHLWWGLTLMVRSYTYDEVLHLWWGLTIMMGSYDHDEVITIKMRSYDHNKVLRSWWGLANTRSYIHDDSSLWWSNNINFMLREDLQLWSATFLAYVSFSV